ncbi:hypothetical protein BV25DRAFT_295778 [Artomyces pyxidatus]|uniref:Uncharacterized protein n=1 Tax=Artomyces pyxidatus TaxID=48021 RepID=A0ACB8T5T6_9AGAM|nr:hypothetical protein BV25DRAFT_295778 [Artomyces pyxidatus]
MPEDVEGGGEGGGIRGESVLVTRVETAMKNILIGNGRGGGGGSREGNYGDSSGKLWTMYITQAGEYDKELAESWKGDMDGIIVFTGLFSATVAAFIIESYKQLSPDSGDGTVQLLIQLSNQVAALSNGTHLPFQPQPSFAPPASAIRVNALWFLSLIMSITCALAATLMQQWARQYLQVTQRQAAPQKRARIRAYLFEGVKRFGMARAVDFIPTLLHASVFLFFAGLIDFMLNINTTVGYLIFGFMSVSAGAYALLTMLPITYLNSPFRTPLSSILWPFTHVVLLGVMQCVQQLLDTFGEPLVPIWESWHKRRANSTPPPRGPREWWEDVKSLCKKLRLRFKTGMRQSVERSAANAPWQIDSRALKWTLESLDEDHEWEQFVEGIPDFSHSKAVQNPKSILMDLMVPDTDADFASSRLAVRLSHLLETCTSGAGTLAEDVRRRRLLACTTALWHIAETFNLPAAPGAPPPYRVRLLSESFGSPALTRALRADADPRIVVTGQCMGALIARRVIRDIKSGTTRFAEGDSQSLAELLGEPAHVVLDYLVDASADIANLISVVSGILPLLASDPLSNDTMTIVWRTLELLHDSARGQGSSADVRGAFMEVCNAVELHTKGTSGAYRQRVTKLAGILQPIYRSIRAAQQQSILTQTVHARSTHSAEDAGSDDDVRSGEDFGSRNDGGSGYNDETQSVMQSIFTVGSRSAIGDGSARPPRDSGIGVSPGDGPDAA